MSTVTERVSAGAAYLDETDPGWHERIDLGRLDLGSPCRCILGQLDGQYWTGVTKRRFDWPRVEGLGFNASHDGGFSALTAAWRDLITARRAAGGAA